MLRQKVQEDYGNFNLNMATSILHNKITMAGDVVPYYTVTALVPTLK